MGLSKDQLRKDQLEAIQWLGPQLVEHGEAFLILPVGFGKTIVTLTALKEIFDDVLSTDASGTTDSGEKCFYRGSEKDLAARRGQDPGGLRAGHVGCGGPNRLRTLVVSTKNIVEHTWGQEIAAWDHLDFNYAAATGSKARREKAILSRPDVLGINFESLVKFYDLVDADPSLLPEVLVIDESSKMKDPGANRVRRHCGFRRRGDPRHTGYVHRFKYRVNLSATPAPEGYQGLWSQSACISMTRPLGINITEFRERYCSSHWNGFANEFKVTAHGQTQIEEALRPVCYVAPEQKYMDLPDPIHSKIMVPWTHDAREVYDAMQEDFVVRVHDAGFKADDFETAVQSVIEAPNAGVMLAKLRQACSGFFYNKKSEVVMLPDAEDKLDELELFLERTGDAPVVIFTQFTAEQEQLAERFPDFQIGLPESLEPWDAGEIPGLVLHPRSAGHGVNLQRGSHIACWYSLPYSYEEFHQANGRLHRTGQPHQVSITRFERPDSIDQYVWAKLQMKGAKLDGFVEGVR